LVQAKNFSWSETARIAIAAWEGLLATPPIIHHDVAASHREGNSPQDLLTESVPYGQVAVQVVADVTAALKEKNLLPESDEDLLKLAEALHFNLVNLNMISCAGEAAN